MSTHLPQQQQQRQRNSPNTLEELESRMVSDANLDSRGFQADGVQGEAGEHSNGEDAEEEDKHNNHANASRGGDAIVHRVSLSYQNRLQLLKLFINLRPQYLDPTVSKTDFWKRVNHEISQILSQPFKSSVYTIKRLVKRRNMQLAHQRQHPNTPFRNSVLDDLVDQVMDIFEEEKSKKHKAVEIKKATTLEKENLRKSMLASKLNEHTAAAAEDETSPHISGSASGLPMDSFTKFLGAGAHKLADTPDITSSHMNLPPSGPLLSDLMDSINHLQNTVDSDTRYKSLSLEIQSLCESTFAELRNVNNKLDLIYSLLRNKP